MSFDYFTLQEIVLILFRVDLELYPKSDYL